jgi:hypothetical protein
MTKHLTRYDPVERLGFEQIDFLRAAKDEVTPFKVRIPAEALLDHVHRRLQSGHPKSGSLHDRRQKSRPCADVQEIAASLSGNSNQFIQPHRRLILGQRVFGIGVIGGSLQLTIGHVKDTPSSGCCTCIAPGCLDTGLHYAERLRPVSSQAARASSGLRKPFFPISQAAL